jgi:hypothetical protein
LNFLKSSNYTIYAVVGYYGYHYMAWIDYSTKEEWFLCEDSNISFVGDFKEMIHDLETRKVIPYIVIYRRMNKEEKNQEEKEEQKDIKIDDNDQIFGKPFVLIHLGI